MQPGIHGGMPMQNPMGMGGMPNSMGGMPNNMGGMPGGMPNTMPGQHFPPQVQQNSQRSDGACLRFPDQLPPQGNLGPPAAVDFLMHAVVLSQQKAYIWAYIDKPSGKYAA